MADWKDNLPQAAKSYLEGRRLDRDTRRAAVDRRPEGRAVAFAPRGDAEQMPEAVIGHWVGPLVPRVAAPARSSSRPPTG